MVKSARHDRLLFSRFATLRSVRTCSSQPTNQSGYIMKRKIAFATDDGFRPSIFAISLSDSFEERGIRKYTGTVASIALSDMWAPFAPRGIRSFWISYVSLEIVTALYFF